MGHNTFISNCIKEILFFSSSTLFFNYRYAGQNNKLERTYELPSL